MEKSVQITSIIVAGIVIVAILAFVALNQIAPSQSNTISVNGQATVDATPDLVTVYFNVETKDADMDDARDENAEIVEDLKVALIMLGLEKKQIETQSFSVNPYYNWNSGSRTQNGYIAQHSIRVELPVEQSDLVNDIIDAGVDAGAAISYINFELSQELQNALKAEAMKLAAQDAKIKAESVAEGFEKKLGKLISTSVDDFGYRPWGIFEASAGGADMEIAKAATTDIQPSEQKISARVTAVYKLR